MHNFLWCLYADDNLMISMRLSASMCVIQVISLYSLYYISILSIYLHPPWSIVMCSFFCVYDNLVFILWHKNHLHVCVSYSCPLQLMMFYENTLNIILCIKLYHSCCHLPKWDIIVDLCCSVLSVLASHPMFLSLSTSQHMLYTTGKLRIQSFLWFSAFASYWTPASKQITMDNSWSVTFTSTSELPMIFSSHKVHLIMVVACIKHFSFICLHFGTRFASKFLLFPPRWILQFCMHSLYWVSSLSSVQHWCTYHWRNIEWDLG